MKGSQIEPQKDFNAFPSCLFFWRIKEGKEANGYSPIATFFPQGISYLVLVPLANKGESYLAPMNKRELRLNYGCFACRFSRFYPIQL